MEVEGTRVDPEAQGWSLRRASPGSGPRGLGHLPTPATSCGLPCCFPPDAEPRVLSILRNPEPCRRCCRSAGTADITNPRPQGWYPGEGRGQVGNRDPGSSSPSSPFPAALSSLVSLRDLFSCFFNCFSCLDLASYPFLRAISPFSVSPACSLGSFGMARPPASQQVATQSAPGAHPYMASQSSHLQQGPPAPQQQLMQQMIQLLAGRKFTGTQGSGLVLGPCSAKGGSQVETSWFWVNPRPGFSSWSATF